MSRELTAGDLARRNGIDRKTAWRWMRAVYDEYGPAIVSRRGRRGVYVTTEDAWARVAILVARREAEERRLSDIELRIEIVEQRVDRQSVDVSELYRQSRAHRPR